MALVLAMQEGRAFYVGNTRVEIAEVRSIHQVKIKVQAKGAMDAIYTLTTNSRVEILDRVYVQLGLGSTASLIKIAIEAPREVTILRDALYEADGC